MDELATIKPRIFTRNVLKAIAVLQNGQSIYLTAEEIVQKVAEQMRRKRDMDSVKSHVLKSLSSLTELGILTRNTKANYNFYNLPQLFSNNCQKRNNYVRKNYRPRKLMSQKPKRQMKLKNQAKFKNAPTSKVVCNSCLSCVMPFVKTYSEFKKMQSTYILEKAQLDQLKISDSATEDPMPELTNHHTKRFEFKAPTILASNNNKNNNIRLNSNSIGDQASDY